MAMDKYYKAVYVTKQKHPKVGRGGEKFELVFYVVSPTKGLVREKANSFLVEKGEVIDHFLAPAVDEVDKIEYEANVVLDSSNDDDDNDDHEQTLSITTCPAKGQTTAPVESQATGDGVAPIKFNIDEDRGFTFDATLFISVSTWYYNNVDIEELNQNDINYVNFQASRLCKLDQLSTYCAVICALVEPRFDLIEYDDVIAISEAVYNDWTNSICEAFTAGAEVLELRDMVLNDKELDFARSRVGLPLPEVVGDKVATVEMSAPIHSVDSSTPETNDDFFASMGINLDFDAAPPAQETTSDEPIAEPVLNIGQQIDQLNDRIDALKHGESIIIDDLPNDVYHGAKGYSKSSLDLVKRDPALLEWSRNAPVDEQNQNANDVGSATHCLILEPHHFDDEYIISPVFDRRTKQGKIDAEDFAERNKHLTIIDAEDGRKMSLMSASVHAHPLADRLLNSESGIAEQSIFWREPSTGFVFKIRPDYQCQFQDMTFIIDLKTSAKIWQFESSVAEYRYHVQDAFYSWVYQNATGKQPIFAFLAVSKSVECGKYPVRLCQLTDEDKHAGNLEFNRQIETIKNCFDSNVWGGFESITRPFWAKRND